MRRFMFAANKTGTVPVLTMLTRLRSQRVFLTYVPMAILLKAFSAAGVETPTVAGIATPPNATASCTGVLAAVPLTLPVKSILYVPPIARRGFLRETFAAASMQHHRIEGNSRSGLDSLSGRISEFNHKYTS